MGKQIDDNRAVITHEGKKVILEVMRRQSVNQETIAGKIGKERSSVSLYLGGQVSLSADISTALYKALKQAREVNFLKTFAQRGTLTEPYLVAGVLRVPRHPPHSQLELVPFYRRLDEVYATVSDEVRCRMMLDLEGMITKYNKKTR